MPDLLLQRRILYQPGAVPQPLQSRQRKRRVIAVRALAVGIIHIPSLTRRRDPHQRVPKAPSPEERLAHSDLAWNLDAAARTPQSGPYAHRRGERSQWIG